MFEGIVASGVGIPGLSHGLKFGDYQETSSENIAEE
jgi:hypothetical protein